MKKVLSRAAAALLVVAPMVLASSHALAQAWPSKPIRLVFPYPGGSIIDAVGRQVTLLAQETLGQPFVWDNRGGANGIIGTDIVAKSPADGYTVHWTTASGFLYNPFFYKSVSYDVLKDFTPISAVIDAPISTVVHASIPVNNVTQLVEYAKRNPGKLNCGSFGIGSVAHIYCELIKIQTGAEWLHVPFKGAAALVTDLSVGRVEVSFLSVGSVVQHWKAGKVKVLALNDPARYKTLPDLPAITEEMPRLELLGNWMGLLAPANLPPAITSRLYESIAKATQSPELRKRLDELYMGPIANRPEEFAAQLRREYALGGRVVKAAGIQPE